MKRVLLTLAIAAAVNSCTLVSCKSTSSSNNDELIVFAAASLTDAFDELANEFEADHPGVSVICNYSSSSQLAVQLVEGAQADVYASANERQMQVVLEAGRIEEEPFLFASNYLVVIVPADNPANLATLKDLAEPGVQLVLAVPGTPIRDYSDQVFSALADDALYGPAFRESVYANLVSEENTVRRVVTKVALGEADAGVVYSSDVTPDIADAVQQFDIPEQYNVLATYPIGLISDAPHPRLARAFINFVLSDRGQAILAHWGFGPAPAN